MLCFLRSSKHRTRQLVVLTVEKVGHTTPKLGVLLGIEIQTPAKNMAITHSIVKVLKKVSLMGEAEHIPKGNKKQLRQNSKPPRTVNQVNECFVCGKERVTKLPKYFKWPWKDEEY